MKDMRFRPTRIELLVIVAVVFLLGTTGYDVYATRLGANHGERDAAVDVAAGRLCLKVGGLRRPWNARAEGLFRERYGIELQHVHGCTPTQYESRYVSAYNNVMMDRIVKQVGPISMAEVFDAARDEWNKAAAH